MRTPPLLRLTLCDVLPVGNRGTKARSTAATIARVALETAIRDGVTEDEAEPVALKASDFWRLTAEGQLGYIYDTMSIESVASAKTQANSEYAQRIDRVIDYLRRNLDRPVKLAELADVACFSEFHFHRVFRAVSGETLNNFTNRLRLEKAARLLRYSDQSLTDIA